MQKDDAYLLDILDACNLIIEFAKSVEYHDFEKDIMRQDAIIRRIEILGEATRRLSVEFKDQHKEIPWHLLRGMRDRLIHEYDEVDIELIWDIIQNDIPELTILISPLINE